MKRRDFLKLTSKIAAIPVILKSGSAMGKSHGESYEVVEYGPDVDPDKDLGDNISLIQVAEQPGDWKMEKLVFETDKGRIYKSVHVPTSHLRKSGGFTPDDYGYHLARKVKEAHADYVYKVYGDNYMKKIIGLTKERDERNALLYGSEKYMAKIAIQHSALTR